MMVIYYLSSQPSLPRLTDRFGALQSIVGHVVEYGMLALLLYWALEGGRRAGKNSGAGRAACWAFVIAVAYGITDEVHQRLVPGRFMDPLDLLADAAAAAVALWAVDVVTRRRAAALRQDESRPPDLPGQS
jgi:VanZ family protein